MIEQYRLYVSQHRLKVAIIGGLIATHITTNTGMWYHGIGLPDLNFNWLNGLLVFGNSEMDPAGMMDPVVLTLVGGLAHYAMGVSFSVIFAFGIAPLIPFRESLGGNIAKAIVWGLALATLSCVWWINLFENLAGPGVNAGIFMSNFGPDQLKWVAAVYLWHIVYGFNLGAIYNPAPVPVTESEMAPSPELAAQPVI
ncbi:MAG TPA: hypothetical protein VEX41_02430 [Candidatus Eisenbacteria bacterium]|nr:hypothetical protein [Candidatus Eisenbacteria bacterium]